MSFETCLTEVKTSMFTVTNLSVGHNHLLLAPEGIPN